MSTELMTSIGKLNFRNMVLCHEASTKMPLRASMLLMLLDSLDLGRLPHGSVTDLRDAVAYTLLYFTLVVHAPEE
eukprot:COSAG02_NODE_1544_length_11996_cov_143.122468_3_plen_75_part_00